MDKKSTTFCHQQKTDANECTHWLQMDQIAIISQKLNLYFSEAFVVGSEFKLKTIK